MSNKFYWREKFCDDMSREELYSMINELMEDHKSMAATHASDLDDLSGLSGRERKKPKKYLGWFTFN